MEPIIVREWRDAKGNLIEKNDSKEVRRVISETTAGKIRNMLLQVVNADDGTAKLVKSRKIPDVVFGGKTGTAEKYDQKTRSYDKNFQVASFIGLAPVENTRYVCLVLVDDPNADKKHGHVGGVTAGPIFRKIMESIYYHPKLSPLTHKLAQIKKKNQCDVDFRGMNLESVKRIASERNCPITIEGEGNRVVSMRTDVQDSFGVTLTMRNYSATKMPNLEGLSLKEAMEVMGNIRMNVEYEGRGRIVSQYPKAETELTKGTICKLKLKEKV